MTGTNPSNQARAIKVLWEYIVKDDHRDQFIAIYSPDGAWSKLFSKHPGFIRTELIQDSSNPNRFVTIDHWVSLSAYSDMKHRSRNEYKAIDEHCEVFTVDENYIGVFELLSDRQHP